MTVGNNGSVGRGKSDKRKMPVSQFEDFGPMARQDGELYCDYACRRWINKRVLKAYLQGKLPSQVIWDGKKGQVVGSLSNRKENVNES